MDLTQMNSRLPDERSGSPFKDENDPGKALCSTSVDECLVGKPLCLLTEINTGLATYKQAAL